MLHKDAINQALPLQQCWASAFSECCLSLMHPSRGTEYAVLSQPFLQIFNIRHQVLSVPQAAPFLSIVSFFFLIYDFFLFKDNCFTEFCCFLSNLNMNKPQVYTYPLPFEPPSYLQPYPTPLGWYRGPVWRQESSFFNKFPEKCYALSALKTTILYYKLFKYKAWGFMWLCF